MPQFLGQSRILPPQNNLAEQLPLLGNTIAKAIEMRAKRNQEREIGEAFQKGGIEAAGEAAFAAGRPDLGIQLAVTQAKLSAARPETFTQEVLPDGTPIQVSSKTGKRIAAPMSIEQRAQIAQAGADRINVSTQKGINDKLIERAFAGIDAGAAANQKIVQLNQMEEALNNPDVFTGPGGQVVNYVKGVASVLGIPVKGAADAEIADRMSKRFAISLASDIDLGKLSNDDRAFLQSIPAGLTTLPEGNRRLIALERVAAQASVEKAAIWNEALANRDDQGSISTEAISKIAEIDARVAAEAKRVVADLRAVEKQASVRSPLAGLPPLNQLSFAQIQKLNPKHLTADQKQIVRSRIRELEAGAR